MGTTSGVYVNLTRQYTFKTTIDTEWIEKHLNSLPRRERSEFIRNCVISGLDKSHKVTQKVTQDSNEPTKWKPSPNSVIGEPDNLFNEGVEIEEDIDLDNALDKLDFD